MPTIIYELIDIDGMTYRTRIAHGYRLMIDENDEWVIACSCGGELLPLVSGRGEECDYINIYHSAPELDKFGWAASFPEVNVTCMDLRAATKMKAKMKK